MAPPPYADIGKFAKDIVNKGFPSGYWALYCNTRTKHDIWLSTSCESRGEIYKGMIGFLKAKYSLKDFDFTQQWDTKNDFLNEISCTDYLAEGLKLGLETTYGISAGDLTGKCKLDYVHEYFNFNCESKLESNPLITASIVVGYDGWIAGYKTAFDVEYSEIPYHSFELGFSYSDFSFLVGLYESNEWYADISAHCFDNLDLAFHCAYTYDVYCDFAARYQLNEDSIIRAKLNTDGLAWIGYQQKLHDGIQLFLSARNDMKVGAILEIEAFKFKKQIKKEEHHIKKEEHHTKKEEHHIKKELHPIKPEDFPIKTEEHHIKKEEH